MKKNYLVGLGLVGLVALVQACAVSGVQEDTTTANESAVRVEAALHYNYPISYHDGSFSARMDGSNHPTTGTIEIKKNAGPDQSHYGIKYTAIGMGGPRPAQVLDLETGDYSIADKVTAPPDKGTNVFEYIELINQMRGNVASIAAGDVHPFSGPRMNPHPELNDAVAYLDSVLQELKSATTLNGLRMSQGWVDRSGPIAKVNVDYRAAQDSDIWAQACDSSGCHAPRTVPVAGGQGGTVSVDFEVGTENRTIYTKLTVKLLARGADASAKPMVQIAEERGVRAPDRIDYCLRHNYFLEPNDQKMRLSLNWATTEPRDLRVDVFDRDTQKWLWGVQEALPTLQGTWDRQVVDFTLRPNLTVRAKLLPRGGTWQNSLMDHECL